MPDNITPEKLDILARSSNPKALKSIRDMLDIPVPTESDPECIVASRCKQAVCALRAYGLYLLPSYYSNRRQITVLPGMNEAETWVLLWKWFLLLEVWGPSFGGIAAAPAFMKTADWYNDVIHAIFDLVFVLVHHHAKSSLTQLISGSESFIRFCVQVMFGALTVEKTSLYPVVAVMVHSFWKTEVYEAACLPQLIDSVMQDNPKIDFYVVTMKRFSDLVKVRTILPYVVELHALGVVLLQLYPLDRAKMLLLCAPRWFARCVSTVMKSLRRETEEGTTVSLSLDTESIGKMSILCFRFLLAVGGRGGSSGWVLEALNAGLFGALSSVKLFLGVEILRSRLTPVWTYRKDMISLGNALLDSLIPHLLTPSVLRSVKRDLDRYRDRDMSVLPSWSRWSEMVALVLEVYRRYKRSPYRYDTMRRCTYPECPTPVPTGNREVSKEVGKDCGSEDAGHAEGSVRNEGIVLCIEHKSEIETVSGGVVRIHGDELYDGCEHGEHGGGLCPEVSNVLSVMELGAEALDAPVDNVKIELMRDTLLEEGMLKGNMVRSEGCTVGFQKENDAVSVEGEKAMDDEDEESKEVDLPYKLCRGCLQSSYCSKPCQVMDWRCHRLRCKVIGGERRDGIHSNLYCDKGFIRYYIRELLSRREEELQELRSTIEEKHYIVFNFGLTLDVLCIMAAEEMPQEILGYRPQSPKGCADEDLVVVLCEKQSLVLWMWYGPQREPEVISTDY
ncbi:hypothetical protein VNI00_017717 [Paramarasmius palmivorus]|uniref:MYND-type domain-containing protein n=1 Tax=Paramarasmius palmivorus TaxID=297713 RepID=A0AAW0B4Y4_9AGAR